MAADRDLLFGLLALQNGMVTRDQLVAAFGAWTATPGRPMAELLVEQSALTHARRALLDALAVEHLAAHGGDPQKSLAALELSRSTRESLAAAGPVVEATLAHVGSGDGKEPDADRTVTYAVGSVTSDGRRFRLLRPHARGGIGAVFVALDEELHREVALKQMLDPYADDTTSRQRFVAEAEITGGLEHPGIVPVYGLGRYADGRPYYAMRFIRGDSLKEAIERFHADDSLKADPGRRSLELRKLLRRFTDVCNAVEYAHTRGVLHRDIKPGNVIVGRHGETLVVDWGLAKATGRADPSAEPSERTLIPSSASGSAETLPGSALGTPAYMSPEQAAGDFDRLGPRSDVYSLGATLYYLLAGRPAFEGDAGEVLRAVQRGEFPPPRRLDPSADKALEAVCLKAMAVRPEDRYASCKALAEDVERWAADEPVTAWREPVTVRARRWLGRHRPLVAGTAALLLTATVALGVGIWRVSLEQAETERRRLEAEGHFAQARSIIDKLLVTFADERLPNSPGMERLREQLIGDAVARSEHFLGARPDDLVFRRQAAQVYRRAGNIERLMAHHDAALRHYRAARGLLDGLADRDPADRSVQFDRAELLIDEANLHRLMGRHREAEPLYTSAIGLMESIREEDPESPDGLRCRRLLALGLLSLGYLRHETGHRREALPAFERAGALYEGIALRLSSPGDPLYLRVTPADELYLQMSLKRRAQLLRETGDASGAARLIDQALARVRAGLARRPDDTDGRNMLVSILEERGRLLAADPARRAEGLRDFDEAIAIGSRLATEFPRIPSYRENLADALRSRGVARPDGIADFERARDVLEALVAEVPAAPRYRARLGRVLADLTRAARARGPADAARALAGRAVAELDRALKDDPENAIAREARADLRSD
jgi:serine/threonine-protein kinase